MSALSQLDGLRPGAVVDHDPVTAYQQQIVDDLSVAVVGGDAGERADLLRSAYVLRPLVLRQRRVVVMDRTDRGGHGEYADVARQVGVEPLRFVLGGGGLRLNPLDPALAAFDGHVLLLRALAELANDGQSLTRWEQRALRAAVEVTVRDADAEGITPRLGHVLAQLGVVGPEFDDCSSVDQEQVRRGGIAVWRMLSALVSGDLAGLFDGETSPQVRLGDGLTVFDVSQLPHQGPAASAVTAWAYVWVTASVFGCTDRPTNFVAVEGSDLAGGPAGRVRRRASKLARGLGLSTITAWDHVHDRLVDEAAYVTVADAATVHLLAPQREEDVAAAATARRHAGPSREVLRDLEPGHHLLVIGHARMLRVDHSHLTAGPRTTSPDDADVAGGHVAPALRLIEVTSAAPLTSSPTLRELPPLPDLTGPTRRRPRPRSRAMHLSTAGAVLDGVKTGRGSLLKTVYALRPLTGRRSGDGQGR